MKRSTALIMATVCATLVILSVLTSGCQTITRSFGGTTEVKLEPGRKVITMTWKETDLWILTRARKEGEKLDTLWYQESSNIGVLEGNVVVYER